MGNVKKVVIIGAGPAGLTAAYYLLKEGKGEFHPDIYEESDAIGGISKTVEYHGNRIDIGGHRFFSKSDEVMNLWNEVMPLQGAPSSDDKILGREIKLNKEGPDPEKEDRVMLRRNRVSRILYLHKFFDYPISIKWQTFHNMGFARTMKAGFGYMGSAIHKRKEQSLADFYINRFGKPLYQMFFEDYTEKVWGRNPSQISPDWGSQRVKGLSLWKAFTNVITKPFKKNSKKVETSLIEEFEYPKKGPGSLYEEMAKLVLEMGGEIHMEEEVVKLNLDGDKVTSIVTKSKEKETTVEGDYFISSMPLKDLYFAFGKDNVPEKPYEVATNLVYRDFITVGLLMKKLLIKNTTKIKTVNNIVPDTWIYIQEREVKLGRLQIFNNWSPYMLKNPTENVWIGLEYFASEGDELWSMKKEDFIKMAIKELASINVINESDVLDSTEIKVKKAYPAYFDTYKDIKLVQDHLNTIENLYCVGRNGQHRYNNMDHSMLTAMDAARSIIDPKSFKKEDIWNVNTEKDYAETKKE
ncbi:MAG: NAD(P)/FAD-dependent oxidoreductase [Bacilli bacterium]|jgi:protoporphyrinogen oxidase|nr:NAD(P)/FAD-dependent oxidoreductase [Bacilli bacterium]